LRPRWGLDRFYGRLSTYIAEINNEKAIKNDDYKTRLASVKNFGLWMWEDE